MVSASYEGGQETATMLAGEGYTFVILTRVEGDAKAKIAAAADAAIKSFRPS